jgi:dTDP-glucose 4,6-dehydratase
MVHTGVEAEIITDEVRIRPANSEVERLLGSNDKIQRLTSWRPRYDLDAGLKETVTWFKESGFVRDYKAELYNV